MWAIRSCVRIVAGSSIRLHSRPVLHTCTPIAITFQSHYFCAVSRFQRKEKPKEHNGIRRENLNVTQSRMFSEAERGVKWAEGLESVKKVGGSTGEEMEHIPEGKGLLSPTSSHLLKLIVPIPTATTKVPRLTIFLLRPSQPLSSVSHLIHASLPPDTSPNTSVAFRSIPRTPNTPEIQWSDSTDIGDFVMEAARDREFAITISQKPSEPENEVRINVVVPSFRSRTRFLRQRLRNVSNELSKLEAVKRDCDHIAYRSARRLALGGFGILLVYFGAVVRLTFWDLGREVMAPMTYLSGLAWVICGTNLRAIGREVSYSSLLRQSISARRAKLYKSHGFDLDLWEDLVTEEKKLKREIHKIANNYNFIWDGSPEGNFEFQIERAEKLKGLDKKAEIK
ncbi:unnamed protein product [Rhizoctonia solani]|uniref:Calcium uniporter protein, mitochondrial n=1 Tax=Rhizoctonia solani TaxID=456999 RepID=A0A8H2WMZ2_9AGAM|nr:unnamed protein product [Rhizoctonia solani]